MIFKGARLIDKLFLFYIRKCPNHPFKIRIVNWINDLFFNNSVKVRSAAGDIYGFSTKEYIGHEIIFSGCYEPLTLSRCREILKDGGICVDIGANMGLFSIHLSKLNGVVIYSIEPSIHNFQKLLFNIKSNKSKNINPINIALSNKDSFGFLTNQSPINSGTFKIVENDNDDDAYLIRLCTLSDLINYLNIPEIALIKIDVEGFEMNVFKGLFDHSNLIPNNIIMEFNGLIERTGYTMEECYNYFKNLGYNTYSVNGDKYCLGDPLVETNLWLKKEFS